ncbi:VQ motif-containing protein 4-like isoform X2 [Momordica charantia]|uniref:VQ motif-containing protein 4-like isoform X2 n=1 Tax=Momordica charantia TaxID=3673 RepID=A0A6J1CHL5_MOMCH|nr:VQ motif-containing protein 4-like isoform X2 [Momordica charantia]
METSSNHQENSSPSPSSLLPSPSSRITNTSSCSTSTSNGVQLMPPPPPTPPPPQLHLHSPKLITRSESVNPYPTTFVQADTSSFKQVVQMLTGSPETAKQASAKPAATASQNSESVSKSHIPPIKSLPRRQQSGFKLYERRNSLNKLRINPLIPVFGSCNSGFSPRKPEILSPSILDFPALALSPVTPLIPDPFDRSGLANCSYLKNGNAKLDAEAEEKAIKEKGFYLHPSPTTTPRDSEPRLLPLFPMTSPRVPENSPQDM